MEELKMAADGIIPSSPAGCPQLDSACLDTWDLCVLSNDGGWTQSPSMAPVYQEPVFVFVYLGGDRS